MLELIQIWMRWRKHIAIFCLVAGVLSALVSMPGNPFYQAHAPALQAAVATAILKWHAANVAEAAGKADERSYIWRAAYYDVVLLVTLLCHGKEYALRMAPTIMLMYGEPFADYREEFPDA